MALLQNSTTTALQTVSTQYVPQTIINATEQIKSYQLTPYKPPPEQQKSTLLSFYVPTKTLSSNSVQKGKQLPVFSTFLSTPSRSEKTLSKLPDFGATRKETKITTDISKRKFVWNGPLGAQRPTTNRSILNETSVFQNLQKNIGESIQAISTSVAGSAEKEVLQLNAIAFQNIRDKLQVALELPRQELKTLNTVRDQFVKELNTYKSEFANLLRNGGDVVSRSEALNLSLQIDEVQQNLQNQEYLINDKELSINTIASEQYVVFAAQEQSFIIDKVDRKIVESIGNVRESSKWQRLKEYLVNFKQEVLTAAEFNRTFNLVSQMIETNEIQRQQIEALNSVIDASTQEDLLSRQRISALEQSIFDLKTEREKFVSSPSEQQRLQNLAAEQERRVEELKLSFRDQIEDLKRLQEQELVANTQAFQTRIRTLEEEARVPVIDVALQRQIRESQTRVDELQTQLAQSKARIAEIEKNYDPVAQKTLEDKIAALNTQLADAANQFRESEERRRLLDDQVVSLSADHASSLLDRDARFLAAYKDASAKILKAVQDSDLAFFNTSEEMKALYSALDTDSKRKISDATTELNSKIVQLQGRIAQTDAEYVAQKKTVEDISQILRQSGFLEEGELITLNNIRELSAQATNSTELQNDLKKVRQDFLALSVSNENLAETARKAKEELDAIKVGSKDVSQLDKLRIQELTNQIASSSAAMEVLRTEASRVNAENLSYRNTVEQKLKTSQAENARLQAIVTTNAQDLLIKTDALTRQQSATSDLQTKLNNLNAQRTREQTAFNTQIASLRAELASEKATNAEQVQKLEARRKALEDLVNAEKTRADQAVTASSAAGAASEKKFQELEAKQRIDVEQLSLQLLQVQNQYNSTTLDLANLKTQFALEREAIVSKSVNILQEIQAKLRINQVVTDLSEVQIQNLYQQVEQVQGRQDALLVSEQKTNVLENYLENVFKVKLRTFTASTVGPGGKYVDQLIKINKIYENPVERAKLIGQYVQTNAQNEVVLDGTGNYVVLNNGGPHKLQQEAVFDNAKLILRGADLIDNNGNIFDVSTTTGLLNWAKSADIVRNTTASKENISLANGELSKVLQKVSGLIASAISIENTQKMGLVNHSITDLNQTDPTTLHPMEMFGFAMMITDPNFLQKFNTNSDILFSYIENSISAVYQQSEIGKNDFKTSGIAQSKIPDEAIIRGRNIFNAINKAYDLKNPLFTDVAYDVKFQEVISNTDITFEQTTGRNATRNVTFNFEKYQKGAPEITFERDQASYDAITKSLGAVKSPETLVEQQTGVVVQPAVARKIGRKTVGKKTS